MCYTTKFTYATLLVFKYLNVRGYVPFRPTRLSPNAITGNFKLICTYTINLCNNFWLSLNYSTDTSIKQIYIHRKIRKTELRKNYYYRLMKKMRFKRIRVTFYMYNVVIKIWNVRSRCNIIKSIIFNCFIFHLLCCFMKNAI